MKHNLWAPKLRIERFYRNALQELARQIIMQVGETDDINLITNALSHMYAHEKFFPYAEALAGQMATHLFEDIGRTWRQAATSGSKGREIYLALQKGLQGQTGQLLAEQIFRNAQIIKTLPLDISRDVTEYVAKETLKGRRSSEIAKEIRLKFPAQTEAKADMIGRTEVSKTQTGLIEARSQSLGINWYVWRAVGGGKGDGRTRLSHRAFSGVLINWNDPPAPEDLFPERTKSGKPYKNTLGHYHAGCCPYCRCYPEPVIDVDDLEWPMRIYRGGSIGRINKIAFSRLLAA